MVSGIHFPQAGTGLAVSLSPENSGGGGAAPQVSFHWSACRSRAAPHPALGEKGGPVLQRPDAGDGIVRGSVNHSTAHVLFG